MRSFLLGAFLLTGSVFLGLSQTANAQLQNGWVFLGGALNPAHCQQMAQAGGYTYATFGGYYGGVYYWNGCFGYKDAGADIRNYDVYVRGNLSECKADIEWQLRDVRCREADSYLQCVSRRGGVKAEIERVRCVDRVYPVK
jgi:hypothetical protein